MRALGSPLPTFQNLHLLHLHKSSRRAKLDDTFSLSNDEQDSNCTAVLYLYWDIFISVLTGTRFY